MFNILISGSSTAWEAGQRMSMPTSRFKEFSGDEAESISATDPSTLKLLEQVNTILMYEDCVDEPHADRVRFGQLRGIKFHGTEISFRFEETGYTSRDIIRNNLPRLQLDRWEVDRTHWSIKDGEIPQDILAALHSVPQHYDIVLSFAGEDRAYVEAAAESLSRCGVSVFYDRYEQATLWGKNLAEHFDVIYSRQARYCVMFISKFYLEKMWGRHERRSAFSRSLEQHTEYILPIRFDQTEIPGVSPLVGYLDANHHGPDEVAELICQKLGRPFFSE